MKTASAWLFGSALMVMLGFFAARSLRADAPAQAKHRVVFELTGDDPAVWEALLNNIDNLQKALPGTAVEVVAHGKGLDMLTAAKSAAVRDRMEMNADRGVTFAACENAMRKRGVKKEQLHDFVTTVDSGVAEVVRKQSAGWSYIRSGS